MKTKIIYLSLLTTWFAVASCSQQEFAGDSGSANAYKKGKPGKGNNTNTNNPNGDLTNPNGDPNKLNADDGGKVELVEADLTIQRHSDSAMYKNCMKAEIEGQPVVDLGCNNPEPYRKFPAGANNFAQVKVKLKTNTCNVVKIGMTSQKSVNGPIEQNVGTNSGRVYSNATKPGNGPGYVVEQAPGGFKIYGNDNNDGKWIDLNLSVTLPESSKLKFTIEGSGIPCK